jgi:acyl-coenzyme A synthetase/AMP-(fatty) acid ligase
MRRHDVKVATFIPSYLNVIGFHDLPLRTLISAGEVANSVVLEQYRQAGVRCINGYGPTEAAVAALNHVIDGPVLGRSVPVGRPLDGTLAAVVDSCGAVLPAGFVGELEAWRRGTGHRVRQQCADDARAS